MFVLISNHSNYGTSIREFETLDCVTEYINSMNLECDQFNTEHPLYYTISTDSEYVTLHQKHSSVDYIVTNGFILESK